MIFKTENSVFVELEKLNFSLGSWLKYWYPAICNFLNISSQSDVDAVEEIDSLFKPNITREELTEELKGKKAIIVAPGNSLSKEVATKIRKKLSRADSETVLISVDGATSFLLEEKLIPQIIVSDLDGQVEDQIEAIKFGSILVVHIHGDNLTQTKKFLPQIKDAGRFLFSTQTEEIGNFHNFLGFSDGDRAVCLSANSKIKEVVLYGYDFGIKIGKYSKTKTLTAEKKAKKLQKFIIAKSVINWCSKETKMEIKIK